MALKKRSLKADIGELRLPLFLFLLSILVTLGFYYSATQYWESVVREESSLFNELNYVSSQVSAIEEAEQIIIDNIDRFNEMSSNQVLDDEDRVGILSEIGQIREKYKFFPVTVNISEQQRWLLSYDADVEEPEEQISLRGSQLQVQLPLLHEEDLTRFLAEFLSPMRLMVSERCVVTQVALSEQDMLDLIPHQQASCDFYWYTLRREPYNEEEFYYE